MRKVLEDLSSRLEELGISDYYINSFLGERLVILGSFDISYYHEVEIVFEGVKFINCPVYFESPVFRLATDEETKQINTKYKSVGINKDAGIICIDDDIAKGHYFIVASHVESKFMKVIHYINDDVMSE